MKFLRRLFDHEYKELKRFTALADQIIALDEEYTKSECEHILLNRFAESEEIAKEIYHIAVESTYINDSIIKIDGGRC